MLAPSPPAFHFLTGDARFLLPRFPSKSINCCVTSPPYFGLRDYGTASWSGGDPACDHRPPDEAGATSIGRGKKETGLKSKDLIGIPWRVAFALQTDGWYLRQDIIWHKPNPMPESVRDRCTKAHEYIFMLSKSSRYYYDAKAIEEPRTSDESRPSFRGGACINNSTFDNSAGGVSTDTGNVKVDKQKGHGGGHAGFNERWSATEVHGSVKTTRNKRSVWTVAPKPFKEAHFATFPPDLIAPCILAGCPLNGLVLDPFGGAGTTALVSRNNGRRSIAIELNPDYVAIAKRRLETS